MASCIGIAHGSATVRQLECREWDDKDSLLNFVQLDEQPLNKWLIF
jgi:hypothetical protein